MLGHEQLVEPMLQEKQLKQQFSEYIEPGSNWILNTGVWDDDGEWIDTETWNDGV